MSSLLLTGIGELLTGDLAQPRADATSVLIRDGSIVGLDPVDASADVELDVRGATVMPGLVDGHVHPSFGEWTPAQDSIGWIGNYLHGGTTTMVSAGELHIPGLPFHDLDAELVTSLAVVSARTTGALRPSGVKLHAGTVLLVPGMQPAHFDRLAAAGCRFAKFIFYPFDEAPAGEAERYVEWCHERGILVKVHTGGVSRSGASRPVGFDVVARVRPDIAAHVSGGPIPMPDDELDRLVDETDCALEVCSSMNYASTDRVARRLHARGELHRLTLGTDTPGGTGVIPRGMLRNLLFLAAMSGLDPAVAVAIGTGNTARAHGLDVGVLGPGRPADLVICGPVVGTEALTGSGAIAHGDLPGITHVVVDGEVLVSGRSRQTPPPRVAPISCCDMKGSPP
ncbi:MAG TPA: amidohydrolase family protein [Ilumatobacter sp.]|nr:amidohydrolase family protein [Ilumatobacter sp.]